MSFEKTRISLNIINNQITEDTAELQKMSTMPMATFYRKLKTLTQQGLIKRRQGSGRPRALNQNDEKSVYQNALMAS